MAQLHTLILISGLFLVACSPSGSGTSNNNSPDGAGGSCPQSIVAAPTTAVCAKATKTCVDACADETCTDNCFAADPRVDDCQECTDDAYTACVNTAGCQAAYDALECCIATCADPESDACTTTTCATQNTAYDTCTSAHEDACDDAICFAAT